MYYSNKYKILYLVSLKILGSDNPPTSVSEVADTYRVELPRGYV